MADQNDLYEQFKSTLAKVESDNQELSWGDPKEQDGLSFVATLGGAIHVQGAQFRAMGRWQMHPSWYRDFSTFRVPVDASWDECFELALRSFFNWSQAVNYPPIKAAMAFHLGRRAVAEGKWDESYAERFMYWWSKVRTSKPEVGVVGIIRLKPPRPE